MKKILVDTNAYTRFLAGDEKVLDILAKTETVFMSIFVLGELYAAFRGGNREKKNSQILETFLLKPTVKILNASSDTAVIFGNVKNTLKIAGTPIPINDVWIAAHAFETGSVVVTYDNHFKKVSGLLLWDHY